MITRNFCLHCWFYVTDTLEKNTRYIGICKESIHLLLNNPTSLPSKIQVSIQITEPTEAGWKKVSIKDDIAWIDDIRFPLLAEQMWFLDVNELSNYGLSENSKYSIYGLNKGPECTLYIKVEPIKDN
jgi:hypothetical protein